MKSQKKTIVNKTKSPKIPTKARSSILHDKLNISIDKLSQGIKKNKLTKEDIENLKEILKKRKEFNRTRKDRKGMGLLSTKTWINPKKKSKLPDKFS